MKTMPIPVGGYKPPSSLRRPAAQTQTAMPPSKPPPAKKTKQAKK